MLFRSYNDIVVADIGPEFWDLNSNPPKTPLTVYWNNKGIFDGSNTIVQELHNGCFSINTCDIDKDGIFEIIPMQNQFEDFIYEYNGSSFIKTKITHLPNISHSAAIYSDFDGDKNIDLFCWGYDISGNLSNFKPTIINNFNNPSLFKRFDLPNNFYVNLLLSGDFDKNGYVDFIMIGMLQGEGGAPLNRNHYFFYIENKGNNIFELNKSKLPEYITTSNNGYPMLYTVNDIDNDGDLDFYNINSAMNLFFINDGKGNFKNGLQ